MTTLQELADYVFGFDAAALPGNVRQAVRHAILDLVGASVAGFGSDAARAARAVAARQYAAGAASVWFFGHGLTPAGAAFANASAASALDLDDGHRGAGGHPGASIIPAAVAVAEAEGSGAERFLTAVALGYEVAIRIAAARDFTRLDTLSTGRWCGYGAAACASYLMGLDRERTTEAMAIAGVAAPGLSAAGYSRRMGNSVKEGIPWATAIGLTAAELAREGYTGPTDILDHPDYYDPTAILAGLGETFTVERIYHKPYACCRWIHAAIDAVLAMRGESDIAPSEIDSIEVYTFARALRLSNEPEPGSLEGARYSLPFCIAAAAVDGPASLLPMSSDLLRREDIRALAAKVRLTVDPVLDPLFPVQAPARVRILGKGRTQEREVRFARGDPDNPMGQAGLLRKFTTLVAPVTDPHPLSDAILRLGEEPSLRSLLESLNEAK
jgi:2-methylcitrate dehydratase PrpD